jgi:hypothetical protein
MQTGFIWLTTDPVAASNEHDSELLSSKNEQF